MCYGNLDPKYMVREMDERLKSVAFEAKGKEQAAPKLLFGHCAAARALLARLLRKGPRHV